MSIFLTLAYLFFIGSVMGWILELLYRNLSKHNKKWINPGFCTGPYVPLYGFGLCILFLLGSTEEQQLIASPFWNKALTIVLMAAAMTLIEYVAGLFCLKVLKVRLWDYSSQWGNVQGIICPLFSLAWTVIAAGYDMAVHPHILHALDWLSRNLAFSFFIGVFFGVFCVDVAHSAQLTVKLKKFAEENTVIVAYENIKSHIRYAQSNRALKYQFFWPFRSEHLLIEHLREMVDTFEEQHKKLRK